jgi:MFS family permease
MRVGVSVGEASLSPSAFSMIVDYFPPKRRATAISVYSMGTYMGTGLASLLGGVVIKLASHQEMWSLPVLGDVRPWQTIFFAVGLPGLLLVPILFTIAEPMRRGVKHTASSGLPFREVLAYVKQNRWTFLCHNFGISFVSLAAYSSASWLPTMFQRVHNWSAADSGIRYGIAVVIFGTLGSVSGGRFADYLRERGYRDASMRVMWLAAMCNLPFSLSVAIIPDPWMAYCFLFPSMFFTSAPFGVAAAAITEITPNWMRGQALASYIFVNSLVGLGLGPTAVAVVTDYVFHNDIRVNYSLALVTTCALAMAAILLRLGLPQFVESLGRLRDYSGQAAEIGMEIAADPQKVAEG